MAESTILAKMAALSESLSEDGFDDLPDLGLYMDQVTGYLNRRLRQLTVGGEEAPLTPNMINNYVKSGHISRPVHKKYSREQIGALYMLCSLKKNLSIPDAAALIYFMTAEAGPRVAYERFAAAQKEAMDAVCARIRALPEERSNEALTALAADLIQHACAERLAAEALIAYLTVNDAAKGAPRPAKGAAKAAARTTTGKADGAARAAAGETGSAPGGGRAEAPEEESGESEG